MGNIDGWQGPLSQDWIEDQYELQKRILERERAFGMTPILPAFAGHVPYALKTKYPEANITLLAPWGGGMPSHLLFSQQHPTTTATTQHNLVLIHIHFHHRIQWDLLSEPNRSTLQDHWLNFHQEANGG